MTILATLREAFQGWVMLLRDEPGWHERFRLSTAGLLTALALFYLFVFLSVVVGSLGLGVPTPGGLVEIMIVQSFWLLALTIGIFGTRAAVRSEAPVLDLMVPGVYALIAYAVLGSVANLIHPWLLTPLWLALVYLFTRLGRAAGQWTNGVAGAFAVLTVVLLVGLPGTLYMLATATLPAV